MTDETPWPWPWYKTLLAFLYRGHGVCESCLRRAYSEFGQCHPCEAQDAWEYGLRVNRPLTISAIEALRDRIAAGDLPRYRVRRKDG